MPAWSERAGAAGDDGARRGETQSEEIAAIAASRESRLGARDMSRAGDRPANTRQCSCPTEAPVPRRSGVGQARKRACI